MGEEIQTLWSQIEREKLKMLEREYRLQYASALLVPLYRQNLLEGELIEVPIEFVQLWRRQCNALERSQKHRETIDLLLEAAKNSIAPSIKISIRDHAVMMQDNQDFMNQAFQVMADKK